MSAIATKLPEEVAAARDGIVAFANKEVMPRHEANRELFEDPRALYDENGRHSPEVIQLISEVREVSAAAGFYQMCVPEHLGGGGLGHLAYYVAWEALFHHCGPQNWLMLYALSHWAFGPSKLLDKVTDVAREKILPGMMSGSKSMCFGLSEPNAGSDARMINTRATKDGDGWRITGRKIWTTNSPIADYCIVFAVTDRNSDKGPGITGFLVPTDTPGFTVQRVIKMFGRPGGDEAELTLDDVYVEPWQVVGEVNQGFAAALYGVSLGRIYNSARAVGTGRWAVEKAIEFAKTRVAFGQSISNYQGVTFPLANCATELHAAHLMGLNAGLLLDQGQPAIKELSMTKAYSVKVGFQAVDQAMQAHGAMGFTNEMGFIEGWHALRSINVADGTGEILNRTIVQRMLKGDLEV